MISFSFSVIAEYFSNHEKAVYVFLVCYSLTQCLNSITIRVVLSQIKHGCCALNGNDNCPAKISPGYFARLRMNVLLSCVCPLCHVTLKLH